MKQKNFYEVKNLTQTSVDIYIYGTICLEKEINWWTGETIENETDVYLMDFKKTLDEIGNVDNINLYINSPGGNVFVTSTIISMLRRIQEKGTKIDAYIDALAASAASFLIMIADNIHIYKNSMLMLHKPMSYGYGNAIELQKVIDELEQVENSTMIPMYMSKVNEGITEDEIKELIVNESWLGAKEIEKYFNVIVEDSEKAVAACINENIFAMYKNVPKELINNIKVNIPNVPLKEHKIESHKEEIENNLDEEALIRNKLNLIKASLFMKKNKK